MSERLETVRYDGPADEGADNFDEYFSFTRMATPTRVDDRPFRARAAFWMLDQIAVTEQRWRGGVRASRGEREVRLSPSDHLTLVALFDGDFAVIGEETVVARPGDLLLLDYRRMFEYRTNGHHGATVSLPRSLVEDRLGPVRLHGLLPGSGETRLLEGFIRTLVGQLPDLLVGSVPTVSLMLRQLALASLARAGSDGPVRAVDPAYEQACAYIHDQPAGTLDPDRMVRALGFSRSHLYRMFRDDGGIKAFDRRRRLRLLHAALIEEDPSRTASEIAVGFGFLDPSSAARQFRTHFGYSMSELRRHLSPPRRRDRAASAALAAYRDAIETLTDRGGHGIGGTHGPAKGTG